MMTENQMLTCFAQALRKEYDDAGKLNDPLARNASALTIHRVAHILVGKLQREGVVMDEARFLKEACDGDPGDY